MERKCGFLLLVLSLLFIVFAANKNRDFRIVALETTSEEGPKIDQPKKTERGRQQEVDEVAAHRWKEQSREEDRRAFDLRRRANKKFDAAQELMRKAAVLRHKLSRTSATEEELKSNLKEDEHKITADEDRLKSQKKLMKEYAEEKKLAKQEANGVSSKEKSLTSAMAKLNIDNKHEEDQRKSVNGLLDRASHFAKMAVKGLKESQQLRLKSESDIGHDGEAARAFQQSASMKRKSNSWTREALDLRSRARLAQEYVAILAQMVSRDEHAVKAAQKAAKEETAIRARVVARLKQLHKEAKREKTSKIMAALDVAEHRRDRDAKHLTKEQSRAKLESVEAESDETHAMADMHSSHEQQAKAAKALDAATRAIRQEESRA